jgi:hypothetical protein
MDAYTEVLISSSRTFLPMETRVFDPEAARRFLRERWIDALYEAALGPLDRLITGLQKRFSSVPFEKRRSRNKVARFRFRDAGNEALYREELDRFSACAIALNSAIRSVAQYVAEAHESSYEDVKARLFDAMDRWDSLMPNKLLGRTDEGILEYTRSYRELSEVCLVEMFPCEESMRESAARRHDLRD